MIICSFRSSLYRISNKFIVLLISVILLTVATFYVIEFLPLHVIPSHYIVFDLRLLVSLNESIHNETMHFMEMMSLRGLSVLSRSQSCVLYSHRCKKKGGGAGALAKVWVQRGKCSERSPEFSMLCSVLFLFPHSALVNAWHPLARMK